MKINWINVKKERKPVKVDFAPTKEKKIEIKVKEEEEEPVKEGPILECGFFSPSDEDIEEGLENNEALHAYKREQRGLCDFQFSYSFQSLV